MAAGSRAAFTAVLLLDRRQQVGAAAITAVAVDPAAQRLYLGLDDGVLEEHAVLHSAAGLKTSLAARKHAAKKAIAEIHLAPAQGLLVLLSDDGAVQVLDAESLEGRPLPLRFLVYELPGAGAGTPPRLLAQAEAPDASAAVRGMAWVGAQLAVCAGMRYLLVSPGARGGGGQLRELLAVPEDLAYSPAMLAAMPDLGRAVLVVGPAAIVVDAGGSPVGSALRLEALGATPRAVAAAGPFLLVVSEAAIHVFDRDGGGEVQRLGFGPGLRPAPGQALHAAAAAAGGEGGGCVAVAGRRLVWLCLPVPPAEQARELLGRGEFEAALELAERGLRRGADWAQVAAAQAALLLLHECRFEEAARCLEQCSPATFQPAQLFPLFPSHTAPWAQQAASHHRYWGLHPPLPSLEALVSRRLGIPQAQQQQQRQRRGNGSVALDSPGSVQSPQQGGGSRDSSLITMDSSSGGAAAGSPPASGSPASTPQQPAAGQRHGSQQRTDEQGQEEEGQHGPQNGGLQPPAASQGGGDERREALLCQARQSLVQYLFRARMLEGVACLEGVDTLLLLLLADQGAARQAAAFAAVPNHVRLAAVEPRLQAEGWHHALATLHAARGQADAALRIWQRLAVGELASPAGPEVVAAERREALEAAACLLQDAAACPDAALVQHLPWLLAASQPEALRVLTARSLTPAEALPLLPRDSDARWQYLAHVVAAEGEAGGGVLDGALHTELATQLVAALLRHEPSLRSTAPPPAGRRVTGGGGRRPSAGGGRRASRPSIAALVSGGGVEPAPGASAVDRMRLLLRRHLEASSACDADAVLACLRGTGLHEELVVAHAKAGDHMSALRVLALTLHDVAAAEAYARAHLAPADHPALLHLVLHPGPGLEPRWEDACYLITALGDHLDPQEVLQALPPSMPLAAAAAVAAPMLRDRLHRRRQAALARSLHRARLAAAAGVLCDGQARHVAVDEERACPRCHLRLGGKVFVVLQPDLLRGEAGDGSQPAGTAAQPSAAQERLGGTGPEEQQAPPPPGCDGLAATTRRLQQQLAADQAQQVLCYACYRRLAGALPLPGLGPGLADA